VLLRRRKEERALLGSKRCSVEVLSPVLDNTLEPLFLSFNALQVEHGKLSSIVEAALTAILLSLPPGH